PPGLVACSLRPVRTPTDVRRRPGGGRRPRLVHQAPDRLVPHRVVRAARGPAEHAGQGSGVRGEQGAGMSGRFGSVITAMVTPFDEKAGLNVDAAVALARWLTDNGSDGLVLVGTTGEGPVLTDEEDVELWRAVADAVSVPVVAGTGSNDTRHTIELTQAA